MACVVEVNGSSLPVILQFVKGETHMKTLLKIKVGTKTFFIKSSSTYYYVSIEKPLTKKTAETVFEFNITKARIMKVALTLSSLLGIGGAFSAFLN